MISAADFPQFLPSTPREKARDYERSFARWESEGGRPLPSQKTLEPSKLVIVRSPRQSRK